MSDLNPVSYRNLTEQDIPESATLLLKVFGPDGCGEPWTPESSLRAVTDHTSETKFCFVAVEDGKVVGMVLAHPSAAASGKEALIFVVCVDSSYQGQGIGKTLLEKVTQACQDHGLKKLRVLAHPKYLSYDWYQRMGMTPSGWVELEKAI